MTDWMQDSVATRHAVETSGCTGSPSSIYAAQSKHSDYLGFDNLASSTAKPPSTPRCCLEYVATIIRSLTIPEATPLFCNCRGKFESCHSSAPMINGWVFHLARCIIRLPSGFFPRSLACGIPPLYCSKRPHTSKSPLGVTSSGTWGT